MQFPEAPSIGDQVTNPSTGAVYQWDGVMWINVPAEGAGVTDEERDALIADQNRQDLALRQETTERMERDMVERSERIGGDQALQDQIDALKPYDDSGLIADQQRQDQALQNHQAEIARQQQAQDKALTDYGWGCTGLTQRPRPFANNPNRKQVIAGWRRIERDILQLESGTGPRLLFFVYKKVLGEKNPADLMTKYMSAELSQKHLETMNMCMSEGRADAAPNIDSVVTGWYVDVIDGDENEKEVRRRVKFNEVVEIRWIPAEGRSRPTPPRSRVERYRYADQLSKVETGVADQCEEMNLHEGTSEKLHEDKAMDIHEGQEWNGHEDLTRNDHEGQHAKRHESQEEKRHRALWADIEDSEDEEFVEMPIERSRAMDISIDSLEVEGMREHATTTERSREAPHESARTINNDLFGLVWSAQECRWERRRRGAIDMQSSNWLSGGHLEAGRPVPTACAHGDVQHDICRGRSRPSVGDIGRRRSVDCGCPAMHIHACICTVCFCSCADSYTCAVLCSRMCMERSTGARFSVAPGSSVDKVCLSKFARARSRTRTCYALNVVAERRFNYLRSS